MDADGGGVLLGVSQPGGTFVTLSGDGLVDRTAQCAPRDAPPSRTSGSSEIVGCIRRRTTDGDVSADLIAVCSRAGGLKLCTTRKVLWDTHIHRQLFALMKVDCVCRCRSLSLDAANKFALGSWT